MDNKKINRILHYINRDGLTTLEHEYLLNTLNRLYYKRIAKDEIGKALDSLIGEVLKEEDS